MFENEFYFRNVALIAALSELPNHKNTPDSRVDNIMNAYDNVSKEQVMQHYNEFASQEEMEHYVHNLAIANHEIKPWE